MRHVACSIWYVANSSREMQGLRQKLNVKAGRRGRTIREINEAQSKTKERKRHQNSFELTEANMCAQAILLLSSSG